MELISEKLVYDKAAGIAVRGIGSNQYIIFTNRKGMKVGILSCGINGTYPVECLALIAWNNRHLCRGMVALIRGIGGTYTVEYSIYILQRI